MSAVASTDTAFAFTAVNLDTSGRPLTYQRAIAGPDRALWEAAHVAEIDRLHDTGTMSFFACSTMPRDRRASYMNPQVKIKTRTDETVEYRVRDTYGGNISDYTGPTSADVAHLTTIKLFLNSVVSSDAEWMTVDIKDYYLVPP